MCRDPARFLWCGEATRQFRFGGSYEIPQIVGSGNESHLDFVLIIVILMEAFFAK
jgi:hypothetical protein